AGWGHLEFDRDPGKPLIRALTTSAGRAAPKPRIGSLTSLDVEYFLTVGTREATAGRPPAMSIWNEFFDNPAKRPYKTYRSNLSRKRCRVTTAGTRTSVQFENFEAGPFKGSLVFTFFAGSPLVQIEAVATTTEDKVAYFYDAGLIGRSLS